MTDAVVQFKDVEKTYDGKTNVVDGFNLDIVRGEFLTLLGPSGSGKTTCLMMLAGFEAPTAGDITLNGHSLVRVPAFQRNMGMVFQSYALFPHLTVFENIAFPLKHRKVAKEDIAKRVARALEMVELPAKKDNLPAQLSGGQQQRVALARALVFEPDVVLLDEPLGALDKNLREQMQIEIKRLHDNLGITFVFVTHDQEEALTMSDRVVIFNEGIVQQVGSPSDVYDRPQNAFVAGFVGENNILPGTVKSMKDDQFLIELANGSEIVAPQNAELSLGESINVVVRPERVSISQHLNSSSNAMNGTIEEIIYSGAQATIKVKLACGTAVIGKILTNDPLFSNLTVGEVKNIGWRHEDCTVLAAT